MAIRNHRAPTVVTILVLISLLAACERAAEEPGEKASVETVPAEPSACPSDEKLTTYCGFQNPEDLALTPDGKHLIMTGYGGLPPASVPGTLYLFDLTTHEAVEPPITLAQNTWGDPTCTRDSTVFTPHGLDLIKRSDGHYQLAITNHLPRETIEFFELAYEKDTTWSLTWRGCVDGVPGKAHNDVTLTRDGQFYASSMYDMDSLAELTAPDWVITDTGSVWHWRGGEGYTMLPGTNGSFPNGLDLSEDESALYINYWISRRTIKYSLATGLVEHTHEAGAPDNLTVIGDEVWVANHDHSLAESALCTPELTQCLLPFTIHVLSAEDLSVKQAWSFKSKAFGVATVAIPVGNTVWLGTHHGDRMASFEK